MIDKTALRDILKRVYSIKKLDKEPLIKMNLQPVTLQYDSSKQLITVYNTDGRSIVARYTSHIDLDCKDFAVYTDHENLAKLYRSLLKKGMISITPTPEGLTLTDDRANITDLTNFINGNCNPESRFYPVDDYANQHQLSTADLRQLVDVAISKRQKRSLGIALQFDTALNALTVGLFDEIDGVIYKVGSAPTLDTGTPKKVIYRFTVTHIKQVLEMVKHSERMTFYTPPEDRDFQVLITSDISGQMITIATRKIKGVRWINNPTNKRIRHEATPADISKALDSIDIMQLDRLKCLDIDFDRIKDIDIDFDEPLDLSFLDSESE